MALITDFNDHLNEIQNHFSQRLEEVHKAIIENALSLLRQDIEDPQLNIAGVLPDAFMLRANQIGIALFRNGFFSLAERMYRLMAAETLKYRQSSGNWRHIGAIYANIAGACVAQGNIDMAVIELLRAAEDDVQTYGQAKSDSFALTGLLQEYFAKPVHIEVLAISNQVNPRITLTDIELLSKSLSDREYAFLAYLRLSILHLHSNSNFSNEFSRLQLFSSIRNLSALMEIHLKKLTGRPNETLFPTFQQLYSSKTWWSVFENARSSVGATQNSTISVDDRLRNTFSIIATDDLTNFWKGLLVTYIARNYTAHDMDVNSEMVKTYPAQVIGHIVNVMIHANTYR